MGACWGACCTLKEETFFLFKRTTSTRTSTSPETTGFPVVNNFGRVLVPIRKHSSNPLGLFLGVGCVCQEPATKANHPGQYYLETLCLIDHWWLLTPAPSKLNRSMAHAKAVTGHGPCHSDTSTLEGHVRQALWLDFQFHFNIGGGARCANHRFLKQLTISR